MRVFLSSTARDFAEHREAVLRALSGLDGVIPVGMEDFGARSQPPLDVCLNAIDGCDVFVGVVGMLYGSMPKSRQKSFTELEHERAVSRGLPRLIFLAPDSTQIAADLREPDTKWRKQERFRNRLKKSGEVTWDSFVTPEELARKVVQSISNHRAERAVRPKTIQSDDLHFCREYRNRLRALYAHWDLAPVGVAQSGGASKPIVVPLDEMYLPLRFAEGYDVRDPARGGPIEPLDILRRKKPLAIRGAAGVGKTTWMRWTFRRLLLMDDAFPIMVELRALARYWKKNNSPSQTRSLDAFIEAWIEEHVGRECKPQVHEVFAADSRVRPILLVDGWDELGEMGEELRTKLVGFMSAHPKALVVVSSRPYGQGKPSHSDGFDVRDIQPLTDEEISRFAVNFYERCYGQEPISVKEFSSRFVTAVNRTADSKALARTPLLLTMMLLISRSSPLPDKRHLLYDKCIENLLTALPDRKQEEGAELLRLQWRPESSEERRRVVARAAFLMQERHYSREHRTAVILRWKEFEDLLPEPWNAHQKTGFIAWLAGPAGLIVDRSDGTLSFTHLSFQEFLAAWHLNATIEGASARQAAYEKYGVGVSWFETLRLWAALIEGVNPDRLTPVIQELNLRDGRLFYLSGTFFADGEGEENDFEAWLRRLVNQVQIGWDPAATACASAWGASAQESRRAAMAAGVRRVIAQSTDWLRFLRLREWVIGANLNGRKLGPIRKEMSELLDALRTGDARALPPVVTKTLLQCHPLWPNSPQEIQYLRLWPSRRLQFTLRLQAEAAAGASRAQLLKSYEDLARDRPQESVTREQFEALVEAAQEPGVPSDFMRDWVQDALSHGTDARIPFFGSTGISVRIPFWMHEYPDTGILSIDGKPPSNAALIWATEYARTGNPPTAWYIVSRHHYSLSRRGAVDLSAATARPFVAHKPVTNDPLGMLFRLAATASLHPTAANRENLSSHIERFSQKIDSRWIALSRHIAGVSSAADRATLLRWAHGDSEELRHLEVWVRLLIRGDIESSDGEIISLDSLAAELKLEPLPMLDDPVKTPVRSTKVHRSTKSK